MNLALLLPAGLAALAAVLLPLLIHVARRSEQRPTVFAALQWLRRKPKPRHRIRFDEWPLLLVRLLLLVLLALLLARPVLHGAHDDAPWVVVAPGAALPLDRAPLAPAGARWHRLEPGFPALDDAATPGALPRGRASVTSLLRELDATLPPGVALTVLVPTELDGVDGERPRLSRRVEWRVMPATANSAVGPRIGNPSRGDAGASNAALVASKAPQVSVRYAPERESALPYLRAAFAAWSPEQPGESTQRPPARSDIAPVAAPLPGSTRHLIWLAPGALPPAVCEWVRGGGTALLDAQATPCTTAPTVAVWRDPSGLPLVEAAAHGHGRVLRFTRELAPRSMPVLLEGAFPTHLRALFEPAAAPPARVPASAHAPLTGGARHEQPPGDLAPWLIALIALVFAVERTMATGRRQGAAP
jgi:hypothetical protein